MPSSSIENRIGALTPTTSERVPSRRVPPAGKPRPSGKRCAPSSLLPPSGGESSPSGEAPSGEAPSLCANAGPFRPASARADLAELR